MGSNSFNVLDVDVSSLEFGPGGATPTHPNALHLEDVNDDGFTDLVTHYRTGETGIAVNETEICLTGALNDETPFEGCDDIITHPDLSPF